jgi:hypothetical protein
MEFTITSQFPDFSVDGSATTGVLSPAQPEIAINAIASNRIDANCFIACASFPMIAAVRVSPRTIVF